jgi:thiamine pyrophosphokinase
MPKTVIFANGKPTTNLSEISDLIEPDDTIICADGGAVHALAAGLTPDLIVGDLDSLPRDVQVMMRARGVEIESHSAKKDQTDLELALAAAIERGADEILLLTVLGGRLDQHMANVLLLTRREWAGVRLSLAEGNQRAWLLRGPDALSIQGRPGDTFSLLPLSPEVKGLDIENVEWPLQNKTISLGSTLTISNVFRADTVTFRIREGIALAIQISKSQ